MSLHSESLLNNKRIIFLMYVLSILLFIILSTVFIQFTVDDAYITFRYAKNLIESGNWNWNNSLLKEEAYTNFLFGVIAIIPVILKMPVPLFFKLLNLLLLFFWIYKKYKTLPSTVFPYFFLILTACIGFYIHLYSGMETVLFSILIFEFGYVLSFKNKLDYSFLFILFLFPFIRPEAVVFSVVGYLYFILKEKEISKPYSSLSILIVWLIYFCWRINYFEYFWPNSFYLKTLNHYELSHFISNVIKARYYLLGSLLFLAIIGNKGFRIYTLSCLAIFLFVYAPSDLQMNFMDRFQWQILFPVILLGLVLVPIDIKTLAIALVVSFSTWNVSDIDKHIRYIAGMNNYTAFGESLSSLEVKILLGEGGAIPYYSNCHCMDYNGLGTKEIPNTIIKDDHAITTLNPDLILYYALSSDTSSIRKPLSNNGVIYEKMKRTNIYEWVGQVKFDEDYYQIIFLNKKSKDYDALKSNIKEITQQNSSSIFKYSDIFKFKYLTK